METVSKKVFFGKFAIEIDSALLEEITNIIDKENIENHISSEYTNFSDFFRSAITAYLNKDLVITAPRRKGGDKKSFTLRVDKPSYDFFKSIGRGKKTDIIERILESYKIKKFK